MNEQLIRIGIIGSGGIAGRHAKCYGKLPQVQVTAVADIVPGKAEEFIRKHELTGARAFNDYRELLELDLDGISICTPNVAHHETTVASLLSGKHVLVEKPLAVTLEQGIEMVRTAKRTGNMLSVGFQPRYDPNMIAMKEVLRSGVLGTIYYVETGGGRRRGMPRGTFVRQELAGAGALADIGCYSLDMALHPLGYPKPLTVSAYGSNYFGTNPKYHPESDRFDVEDFTAALIRFEGGLTMSFKTAWAMHMDSLGATMFLGTDGGLKVTSAGKGPWSGVWDGGVGSMSLFHDIAGHQTESPLTIKEHQVDRFFEKIRDFVTAILENRPAPIPGEEILVNQAIIDGMLKSAKLGREVAVEIPEM
ncbi:MAG: gfo/Idh/MocA family oxidoreductase [Paenibacillus sp.]|jgi:predicted dehydrogenase|nr:gfo/Idh/MocA family oxidoreductase [Paenibacillus sp.]